MIIIVLIAFLWLQVRHRLKVTLTLPLAHRVEVSLNFLRVYELSAVLYLWEIRGLTTEAHIELALMGLG